MVLFPPPIQLIQTNENFWESITPKEKIWHLCICYYKSSLKSNSKETEVFCANMNANFCANRKICVLMEHRIVWKHIFIELRNLWSKNVVWMDSDINMQFIIASKNSKTFWFSTYWDKTVSCLTRSIFLYKLVTETEHKTFVIVQSGMKNSVDSKFSLCCPYMCNIKTIKQKNPANQSNIYNGNGLLLNWPFCKKKYLWKKLGSLNQNN